MIATASAASLNARGPSLSPGVEIPASSTVPLPPAASGVHGGNQPLAATSGLSMLPPHPGMGATLDQTNALTLVKTVSNLSDLRDRYMQKDINSSLPNEDWNALTYFVAENDLQSVTKLILSGASTDTTGGGGTLTGTGHTPLHVAARYGSVECMECLIRGRVNRPRRDFGSDMEVQMEAEMLMSKVRLVWWSVKQRCSGAPCQNDEEMLNKLTSTSVVASLLRPPPPLLHLSPLITV